MSEQLRDVGGATVVPMTVHPSAEQLSPFMVRVYDAASEAALENFERSGPDNGHVRSSKAEIFRTAHTALRRAKPGEERNALVLGTGLLNDIPIEAIADSFDETVLVDVNTELTERALSSLAAPLLGKISLVRAEVTGAAQSLYASVEEAQKSATYEEFITEAARLISQLDIVGSQADFGEYTFVCSQVLLSQLLAAPLLSFDLLAQRQYGKGLASSHRELQSDILSMTLDEQGQRVEMGHITQLRRQVKKNGTVHYADTLGAIDGDWIDPIVYRGVGAAIRVEFSEVRPKRVWEYSPGIGTDFLVVSHALEPKQSIS